MYGSGGVDVIPGDSGDDFIGGDPESDTLEGNDGNDIIQGPRADNIDGGEGNDTLMASFAIGSVSFRDYAADNLICGPAYDTAFANPIDGDSSNSGDFSMVNFDLKTIY